MRNGDKPRCPECATGDVRRLLSSFAVHSTSANLGGGGAEQELLVVRGLLLCHLPLTIRSSPSSSALRREAEACEQLPACRDAHARRVRRGRPAQRPHVRRRGARLPRRPAGPAVRRPGRQAARAAARHHRPHARAGLHRQRAQEPAAQQPRPASPKRSRPASRTCCARSSSSRRASSARSATSRPSCCPAARPASRACTASPQRTEHRRARALPLPDLPSGGGALHAGHARRRSSRTSCGCPRCSACRCGDAETTPAPRPTTSGRAPCDDRPRPRGRSGRDAPRRPMPAAAGRRPRPPARARAALPPTPPPRRRGPAEQLGLF